MKSLTHWGPETSTSRSRRERPGRTATQQRQELFEGSLEIDTFELEDASWFERDRVRQALEGDSEGTNLIVPPPMAIANFLLRTWIAETKSSLPRSPAD